MTTRLAILAGVALIGAALMGAAGVADAASAQGSPPWLREAREFDAANQVLVLQAKDPSFLQHWNRMEQARKRLAAVEAPPMALLARLLDSPEESERRAALVVMSVRKMTTEALVALVLARYETWRDFWSRSYAHSVLRQLDAEQIARHQHDIARLIEAETNETLLAGSLPTAARLPAATATAIFARVFTTGTDTLRRLANVHVQAAGGTLADDVRRALEREGATDALPFLKKID